MRARFVIVIALLLSACGPVEDAPDDRDRAECLRIEDASALTLPEVEVGCSSRQQLTLINRCDDALRVTGFSLDGAIAHMALVHAPAIPTEGLELPGGGSLTLVVRHAPLAEGPHTARLNLQVRGASADWTLKSAARPMRLVTDTFVNEDEDGLADLLVVIDNGPLLAPRAAAGPDRRPRRSGDRRTRRDGLALRPHPRRRLLRADVHAGSPAGAAGDLRPGLSVAGR